MKKLKDLLFVFVCVTTCVLFVSAAYITIFWPQTTLGVEILWQILMVSFLSSLGIYIYPEREVSKRTAVLLTAAHYIETNALVLGCGFWFEWFYADNLGMVVGMVVVIALVFLVVSVAVQFRARQLAALMNERLAEYQRKNPQDVDGQDGWHG